MQLVVHLLALLALVSASQVDPIHASQDVTIPYLHSLLKRLYTYKTELPPELLNQAIGMQGDRSRLEKTITKLIKGDAVKIALLGGSLSIRGWNFYDESYIRQVHKWIEIAFLPGCKEEALEALRKQAEEEGHVKKRYVKLEHDVDERPDPEQDLHVTTHPTYLSSGHMCDTISNINLQSLAVPAAGPGYAYRCMLQKTPEDVDLVMVDFGVNDYQASNFFSHPERHAYERILRHFLAIEHSPSVLLFEAYAWSESGGFFLGSEHDVHLGQDKHSIIAEYYGNVQLLSARAALYQMMNASAPKGSDIHAFDKRLIYMGHFRDQMHVSLTGHRWYADMIINYIRQVATEVIIKMIVAQTLPKEVVDLVPGMASVALSTLPPATTSSCEVKGERGINFPLICTAPNNLRPPLFKGNEDSDTGVCALGRDFIRTVVKQDGWEWLDEGHTGVHKWGYVSTTVGSKLIIGLELGYDEKQLDLSNPYAPQNRVTGFLIFLVSYEGMGTAELSCIGGCMCREYALEGMSKEKHSVPDLLEFKMYPRYTNVTNADGTFSLTLSTEAADQKCEVQIEILSNTTAPDKGHKFKVIGITTSTSSIWHLDDIVKRDNEHWVDV